MNTMLLVLLPFTAVALIFVFSVRRVDCPDCGERLPRWLNPFAKTRRMWRMGGYLCGACGCETDLAGRKITDQTPTAPLPVLPWAVLGLAVTIAAGLTARVMLHRPVVQPLPVALPVP
jgi:hypothetical protein